MDQGADTVTCPRCRGHLPPGEFPSQSASVQCGHCGAYVFLAEDGSPQFAEVIQSGSEQPNEELKSESTDAAALPPLSALKPLPPPPEPPELVTALQQVTLNPQPSPTPEVQEPPEPPLADPPEPASTTTTAPPTPIPQPEAVLDDHGIDDIDPVHEMAQRRRRRMMIAGAVGTAAVLAAVGWFVLRDALRQQPAAAPTATAPAPARAPKEAPPTVAKEPTVEERAPEEPSAELEMETEQAGKKKRKGRKGKKRKAAERAASTEVEQPAPSDNDDLEAAATRHFEQGLEHFRQRRLKAAVSEFSKAAVARPDYAEAYRYIGMTHTLQENHRAASVAFKRYLALEPNSKYSAKIREILKEKKTE